MAFSYLLGKGKATRYDMSTCVGAFVPHYCSSLGMPDVTIVSLSLSLCVSSLVVYPYLDGT